MFAYFEAMPNRRKMHTFKFWKNWVILIRKIENPHRNYYHLLSPFVLYTIPIIPIQEMYRWRNNTSNHCTTETRFWYREPKPRSNFGKGSVWCLLPWTKRMPKRETVHAFKHRKTRVCDLALGHFKLFITESLWK